MRLEGTIAVAAFITWLNNRHIIFFARYEVTDKLIPTNDVRVGDSLAFAPELQFNASARLEFSQWMGAHVMYNVPILTSLGDIIIINRDLVKGWTMMGVSAGISTETWDAKVYVDNLTDKRAELTRNYINDRPRATCTPDQ